MSLNNSQSSSHLNERGIALTEFLVAFPFLFIVLIGIVDLGTALNQYFAVNRVAYEATRFAASVPVLEIASYDTATAAAAAPGHQRIRERVNTLLTRNGIDPADLPADFLTTARLPAATLGFTRDQVEVRIQIPFDALFPLVGQVLPRLSARVSGPYIS